MDLKLRFLALVVLTIVVPGQEPRSDRRIGLSGLIMDVDPDSVIESFRIASASPCREIVTSLARDVTSPGGRFSIESFACQHGWALVTAPGFAPCIIDLHRRGTVPSKIENLPILMSRGGRLQGRIESADGRPIAGARVVLTDSYGDPFLESVAVPRFWGSRCGSPSPPSMHQSYPWEPSFFGATTATDGAWSFEHAPFGDYRVAVDAAGFAAHLTEFYKIAEGGSTECATIALPAEGRLRGTVSAPLLDGLSKPEFVITSGDVFPGFRWSGPIENGAFTIRRLPPGTHTVSIFDSALIRPGAPTLDWARILSLDQTKRVFTIAAGSTVALAW